MIYLYGLLDGDHHALQAAVDGQPGLEGPVQVTRAGDWALAWSPHGEAEVQPRRRLMLAHTRIQEAMMAAGTLLPARFGLVARNLAEVEALITARAGVIAAEFAKVAGAVELGLRVNFDRAKALAATLAADEGLRRERDRLAGQGRGAHFAMAEFGGKLAERLDRRRGTAQGQLLKALVPLVRDHVLRKPESDTEVLRAELLIAAEAQADFAQAVEDTAKSLTFAEAEPQITLVGPVPPYHFVRLSLAMDSAEKAA